MYSHKYLFVLLYCLNLSFVIWLNFHLPFLGITTYPKKRKSPRLFFFVLTRFYTLIVISVALFDKPAFKNLIANGLILASDGQKMSKRKKNYPDPMNVVTQYGADALR